MEIHLTKGIVIQEIRALSASLKTKPIKYSLRKGSICKVESQHISGKCLDVRPEEGDERKINILGY